VNWKARGKGENNSKHKSFLGLTCEEHEGSRVLLLSSAFKNSYFFKIRLIFRWLIMYLTGCDAAKITLSALRSAGVLYGEKRFI